MAGVNIFPNGVVLSEAVKPFDALGSTQVIARTPEVPAVMHSAGDYTATIKCAHKDGISGVVFTVSDGTNSISLTGNEQSWCTKYASDLWLHQTTFTEAQMSTFNSGELSVTATCHPYIETDNLSRTIEWSLYNNLSGDLSGLVKYVNSIAGDDSAGDGSSSNPYLTIGKAIDSIYTGVKLPNGGGINRMDGGTIYLQADGGQPTEYIYGGGNDRAAKETWYTIARDPAATTGTVIFTGVKSVSENSWFKNCGYLKFEGLVFSGVGFQNFNPNVGEFQTLWVDNCEILGTGKDHNVQLASDVWWPQGIYNTNNTTHSLANGLGGNMARDSYAYDLGSDSFQYVQAVFNCTAYDISLFGTFHPDIWQSPYEPNLVVCGLRSYNIAGAQGIFIEDPSYGRVADILVENAAMGDVTNCWVDGKVGGDLADHVLVYHSTFPSQGWIFPGANRRVMNENCRLVNCVFHGMSLTGNGVYLGTIEDCHFTNTTAQGTDYTTGTIADTYVDRAGYDYRIQSTSVAYTGGQVMPNYNMPSGSLGVNDTSFPTVGAWGSAAFFGFGSSSAEDVIVLSLGLISPTVDAAVQGFTAPIAVTTTRSVILPGIGRS